MKKILIIIYLLMLQHPSSIYAQHPIGLDCDSILKSIIRKGMFFNGYIYELSDYYLEKSNTKHLTHFKLINIYDKRSLYIDNHTTWDFFAFVDTARCGMIIPDTLSEINQIVKAEPILTRYDIAYLSSFYLLPYRKVVFLNNNIFDKYTAESDLFHTIYSSNYYNLKLNRFKRAIHYYVFHKDYYKLMYIQPNDTSIQLVLSLNRQEFDTLNKVLNNKYKDVRNRVIRTSILMTVVFNKDNTVKEVRKQYFIPKLKKFKNREMYFYDSLESLLQYEQD